MKFPLTDSQIDQILNEDGFDCMDREDYNRLYDYYLSTGDMPYGVAKARDGDPDQWMFDQLHIEFKHMIKA